MENKKIEQLDQYLIKQLLQQQTEKGFWTGKLSSSALGTAVAVVAFKINDSEKYHKRIENGLQWLCKHINPDGGYGDTPESKSNVSTTLLTYSALKVCENENTEISHRIKSIENYLAAQGIYFTEGNIANAILMYYGKDLTFSVPILSMLVICGVLPDKELKHIPQLPFELALLPTRFYRFFNLQVVSYAVPALIAVGIYIFRNKPSHNIFAKRLRQRAIKPAIKRLEKILPASGGFLEAIPLTAFVNMCLTCSGEQNNKVLAQGLLFLENQQRNDGSWPIDVDLSNWVSSLAVRALGNDFETICGSDKAELLRQHYLAMQYKQKHAFNDAQPGGWGWTNYAGSVPDADDTPGAILALTTLYSGTEAETTAIVKACVWLADLQNKDGGMPTFCKGWGRLPFDSSSCDLTGHTLAAWAKAQFILKDKLAANVAQQINKSCRKAVAFLHARQSPDGYWLPLWFGSQLTPNHSNPVYGTAKVAIYLQEYLEYTNPQHTAVQDMLQRACTYLQHQQNDDGSWGAQKGVKGSIEETSLAISALAAENKEACKRGIVWLSGFIAQNGLKASPIGLYFAALWYDEEMYPLVYALEALRKLKSES
jgi:prenyltransferase beta subunit